MYAVLSCARLGFHSPEEDRMSLRQRYFAVGLALCLLVVVSGCSKQTPSGAGALSIQLTAPNVNCLQNGQTGLIDVPMAGGACWSAPQAGTPVQVQLPANCPFSQCSYPTNNGSMCSGPANAGSAGQVVGYTSITINGNQCTVGTDGLHI